MKTKLYYETKKYMVIDATEEQAKEIAELNKEMWRQEKAVKKYERSMDEMEKLNDEGKMKMQFIDEDSDIEEQYIEKEDNEEREQMLKVLQKAVVTLKPDQQEIIKMAFTENRSHAEIGQALGVSKQAIQQRIETILKKLKTFF